MKKRGRKPGVNTLEIEEHKNIVRSLENEIARLENRQKRNAKLRDSKIK